MKYLVLFSLSVLVCGCGPTLMIDQAAFEEANPQSLAVLPFSLEDETGRGELKAAHLSAVFARRLAAHHFLQLSHKHVLDTLAAEGLETPGDVAATPAKRLAELLGVDALLRGYVTTLSNIEGGLLYRQAIGGRVQLVDGKSAKTLVDIEHKETDWGGLIINSDQSLEAIQQTLDNSTDIGFVRLSEKWADSIAREFPQPSAHGDVEPPVLAAVELSTSREGVLWPGDTLTITVRCNSPGLEVHLDLGHEIAELPLSDVEDGRYVGWYRVQRGDVFLDEPAAVHVSDRFGVGARRVLDGSLKIDGRVAEKPVGLVLGEGPDLALTWTPAERAVSYQVIVTNQAGLAVLVGEPKEPSYEGPRPAGALRVFVIGVDERGVLGAMSDGLSLIEEGTQ